jgi:hypothetical protein
MYFNHFVIIGYYKAHNCHVIREPSKLAPQHDQIYLFIYFVFFFFLILCASKCEELSLHKKKSKRKRKKMNTTILI